MKVFLVFALMFGLSASAHAGILSLVVGSREKPQNSTAPSPNSQNMALLQAALNFDPNPAKGGGDTTIVAGSALLPDSGPLGTAADLKDTPSSDQISIYTVREGDSLSEIADMFNVTTNTIRWANDIGKNGSIKPGDQLVILPITGIKHTVKSGETLATIAKKYNSDASEVANYNHLDDRSLVVGAVVIVPDGEISTPTVSKPKPKVISGGTKAGGTGLIRPIRGGTKTQGIHGYNGVDLASYLGAEVYAAAGGQVIISRAGGWNGGYGNYIVVKHNNGTQTLYSHLNDVYARVGQQVGQGEVIGTVGNSGRSTGPHLHFEVRGGANPF